MHQLLNQALGAERATDARRAAERWQLALAAGVGERGELPGTIVLRMAGLADRPRLERLAELDSAAPLRGPALVAVVDSEVVAAVELTTRRAIATPLAPTADALDLLQRRAEQLWPDRPRRRRRWRLAAAA